MVPINSKNKEAAFLIALLASSPSFSTLAVAEKDGYFDPYREEHYQNAKIEEIYGKEFLKVHRGSFEYCLPDLYIAGSTEYWGVLHKYINRTLSCKLDPRKSLNLAALWWNQISEKHDRDRQVKQWRILKPKIDNKINSLLL